MLNKFNFTLLVTLTLLSLNSAKADPPIPSHDHWQNTNYSNHYVLYDYKSHSYIETVNCKALHQFKVVSNALNTLTLFDASRGMTMQLNYEGMYLKAKGATQFTFYQKGTFDTRTHFQHFDQKGTYTGALTKQNACRWVEYLAGSHTPSYYFVETQRNLDLVDLYDQSRNMLVRLDKANMYLRTGTNPLAFFKKGHW